MRRNICLICLLLSLTAMAQDMVRMRDCRPRLQEVMAKGHNIRRAPSVSSATNPYIGDRRQLVVLVSFANQSFSTSDPVTVWNKIFNQENYNEGNYRGSLSDYFRDQSNGQFRLTFDLQRVALTTQKVKYCSTEDDENSKYLVSDIMDVLKQRNIDWSQYDWSGDGYVDQLLIIYAGMGMNDGGDDDTIWPHQWWMSVHEDCAPITVSSGGKDYLVDSYCCVQEVGDVYAVFGTLCHEYSHCFGFPDFYNGRNSYVHKWDLMDYGNYNGDGYCPAGYSGHERMLMGWQTPVEIVGDVQVTGMKSTAEGGEIYILRNDGYPDEYYLIENRQQTGWDSELPGSGLLVFHVDYDEQVWLYSYVNSSSRKRYTIFPASNRTYTYYSNTWAYPYEGNNLLTNTSTPAATLLNDNVDGTKLMSKPIDNMQVTGGLASFHAVGTSTGVNIPTMPVGKERLLYSFGRIDIVRDASGRVYKKVRR